MRKFTVWARIEATDHEYSDKPFSVTDDVIFLETDSLERAARFLRRLCGPYIDFTVNYGYVDYCPKCGQAWQVHNDDGSCVEDQDLDRRRDQAIAYLEQIEECSDEL